MAGLIGRTRLTRIDTIANDLKKRIAEFDDGEPIGGGLAVKGHAYWWMLEYGTGKHFGGGARGGGASGEPDGSIPQPVGIKGEGGYDGDYPIVAGAYREPPLKNGKKLLRFWSRRLQKYVLVRGTSHPGIRPYAMVRKSLREFDKRLTDALRPKRGDIYLPDRDDIVDILNDELDRLLLNVVARTPVSDFDDNTEGTHLSDAWSVVLAK